MVQNGAFLETRRELLLTARHFTRCDEEARDLTQDALVAALARGFDDWHSPARRAWLRGVIRKRAAFVARTEGRRRRRESLEDSTRGTVGEHWAWESQFLSSLPRSLRVVAALASIDFSAAEIRWLLGLSDTALRSRLCALRRAVRAEAEAPLRSAPEPAQALGERRAQLLFALRRQPGRVVATHDPDGNVILLRIGPHNSGVVGNP